MSTNVGLLISQIPLCLPPMFQLGWQSSYYQKSTETDVLPTLVWQSYLWMGMYQGLGLHRRGWLYSHWRSLVPQLLKQTKET